MNIKFKYSIVIILLMFSQISFSQQSLTNKLHTEIAEKTAEINDSLIKIRRHLHKYPEIAEEEKETAKLIENYLNALGLEVKTNIGGYGVIGILRGKYKGKKIAWRADIDALPYQHEYETEVAYASTRENAHHICGHDVHTTIALGMANVLSAQKEHIHGTIYFIFQPSEENYKGALRMIDDNLLKIIDPEEIYATHIAPMPAGTVASKPQYLYADYKQLTVILDKNKADEKSIAAIKNIIKTLQNVSPDSEFWNLQNLMHPEIGVGSNKTVYQNYITIKDNFLQKTVNDKVVIDVVVSASNKKLMEAVPKMLQERIEKSIHAGALKDVYFSEEKSQNAIARISNDTTLVHESLSSLAAIYGASNVFPLYGVIPDNRGDDFAYFQEKIPGVYFFLGGSDYKKGIISMPHAPTFSVDEKCISVGVKYFASLLVERLQTD